MTTDLLARIEVDGRTVLARLAPNTRTRIAMAPGPHFVRATALGSGVSTEQEIEVPEQDVLRLDLRLAGIVARVAVGSRSASVTPKGLPSDMLIAVPAGEATIGCAGAAANCGRTPVSARPFTTRAFHVSAVGAFKSDVAEGTSWAGAEATCRSVGGELPTEEQWEYMAAVLAPKAAAVSADADCRDSLDWVRSDFVQRSDQRVARGPSIGRSCGQPRRLVLNPDVVYSNVTVRCVVGPQP